MESSREDIRSPAPFTCWELSSRQGVTSKDIPQQSGTRQHMSRRPPRHAPINLASKPTHNCATCTSPHCGRSLHSLACTYVGSWNKQGRHKRWCRCSIGDRNIKRSLMHDATSDIPRTAAAGNLPIPDKGMRRHLLRGFILGATPQLHHTRYISMQAPCNAPHQTLSNIAYR